MSSISRSQRAYVYIFLPGDGYVPAGLLDLAPGSDVFRFRYGRRYRERPNALPIDPVRLPLSLSGEALAGSGRMLFNALRDAAPDRWGRKVLAYMAGVPAGSLSEFDVLTAAHSDTRVGALAFGPDAESGPRPMASWWRGERGRSVADLKEVARVARRVDELDDVDVDTLRQELPPDAFLQALAGSPSVGGGRPKALVETDGGLWIAKFPRCGDGWNEPRVEYATMTLARRCGVETAECRLVLLGDIDALLVRRFDRDALGQPRHMVSGFTLRDMREDDDWGSYQDLALAALRHGDDKAGPELFRRMAFNILCANTDDHPRNQAFFVSRTEARLTPAYDIVPQRFAQREYLLALDCGSQGRRATLENALSRPEPFGLTTAEAREIMREMLSVARGWREHFEECGVRGRDIDTLAGRFVQAERGLTDLKP